MALWVGALLVFAEDLGLVPWSADFQDTQDYTEKSCLGKNKKKKKRRKRRRQKRKKKNCAVSWVMYSSRSLLCSVGSLTEWLIRCLDFLIFISLFTMTS